MSDIVVGQIITDNQNERDAIHVAVMPVKALHKLYPGQELSLIFWEDDVAVVSNVSSEIGIGIVDPFLAHPVMPGDHFYMFLKPNSTRALRHAWTHPAIDHHDKKKADHSSDTGVATSHASLPNSLQDYVETDTFCCPEMDPRY